MAEQFTEAEKAKRLREIMGRAIKRNKTNKSSSRGASEPTDEDHEELMKKLRETEKKYWEKKRVQAAKQVKDNTLLGERVKDSFKPHRKVQKPDTSKPWYFHLKYRDIKHVDWSQESRRTAFLFIFNIAAMIALLFILFGILVISAIVLYADEEIDILHEMPDIDSSLFKHELR